VPDTYGVLTMHERKNLHSKLAAMEDRLAPLQGKRYWRSLDELADSESFQELMRGEFPAQADVWPESLSRRKFLALMGASLAMAGLGGCDVQPAPSVDIVPYVHQPAEVVVGNPLFFATTIVHDGAGVGLLVESHEGRPTKVEGNPGHPASRGAANVYHQASVLTLYDPDRAKTVTQQGQTRTWDNFLAAIRPAMEKHRKARGAGLRILSESIASPTLAAQMKDLLKDLPEARLHIWEPLHNDMASQAAQFTFGEPVEPVYDFSKADIVLSLDADFLHEGPGSIVHAADYMARRRVRKPDDDSVEKMQMNRLYVVETMVSTTGAKADHRLALLPTEIEDFARAIAGKLGVTSADTGRLKGHEKWIAAIAKDLESHHGRSLVLAGQRQPVAVHMLAHVLNNRLGNVGQTVSYIDPIAFRPASGSSDNTQSLRDLVRDIQQKQVETLVILGGNPVYTAPADLDFAKHLRTVPLSIHHGLFVDETSYQCGWHLPATHFMEMWSDARAYDGTVSLIQPLIEPLYQGRSAHEVLSILATLQMTPGRQSVREHWRKELIPQNAGSAADIDFERRWHAALDQGVIENTAFEPRSMSLKAGWDKTLQNLIEPVPQDTPTMEAAGLQIAFLPDPTLYDGCYANNGWLQEVPKPITRIAWGNAALMSPATAKQIGVGLGSYAHGGEHGGYYMPVVELKLAGRTVLAPVWIVPGHADGAVSVWLGHGRTRAGRVGGSGNETVGFDAYRLRLAERPWFQRGLQVRKTSGTEIVACTQEHQTMESREPVRSATLSEFREHPDFAARSPEGSGLRLEEPHSSAAPQDSGLKPQASLYKPFDYAPPKHKWGMSIDLTTCIGCQACVVACQAENNIPVVGKEQVAAGREMHWIRIDRYFSGTADDPQESHFQPVPCQQCENAPCEYVCPVAATVHSAEGLNDQVYQRCVGTRFCSNNCPYKVRRFNFFHYSDFDTPTRRLQYNPEVTVRSRGVMEKCTYCVQRIRRAERDAEKENRPVADGEVMTACQATCPTQAIVFGDMNDPKSRVKQEKDSPLNYALLADVNTNPRTTYLAAIRNPNPELEAT
jgi:molybdopterin-containing oxidoreductase family iron-sulfur binding subunit